MSRKSEGSIYQVPGGWRGAISLGNGKRKTVKRKTRGEVAQEIRKLLTLRDRNKPISTSKRTVDQFLQQWLDVHVKPNRAALTYDSYASAVARYIVPTLGRIKLDQLTGAQVQMCLNECTKQGCGPKYVRNISGALKSALSTAQVWQYVERNVAKDATPPKQVKFKPKPLTAEQADKLLNWLRATEHRFEALYHLALMMGFRRGELLGLQWSDIDFSRGTIHIQHNCQRNKGKGMVLTCVKSEDSDANVPMPPLCIAALLRRQIMQERDRVAAGPKWEQHAQFVFTSPRGKPLLPNQPLNELRQAMAVNELPEIRLHDMRHSTAQLLLLRRVPMKMIQAIMRHSTFQITMDLYAHLAPTELRETAQTMNDIFTDLSSQKILGATHAATPAVPETVQ